MHYSSAVHSLYLYCAGKQQRSYFRNEAIKRIQNEHNPLVNQHMAMSFACLWITNLWGEFLQMEFSMPCALCFKHGKQTNKSVLGPELLQLPFLSPSPSLSLLSDDLQLTNSDCKRPLLSTSRKNNKKRWGGTFLLDKQKEWEKKEKQHLKLGVDFLSFFFFGLN